MALIRIILSLILWFPASALVYYIVASITTSVKFSWPGVIILSLITAWIMEILMGPKGH